MTCKLVKRKQKAHKLLDLGRQSAGQKLQSANVARIHRLHFQPLCAQRDNKIGFSWRVENSDNEKLALDFPTPINITLCSICNRLAKSWRGLGGWQIWRIRECWGLRIWASENPPMTSQYYQVLLYLPPFGRNSDGFCWDCPHSTNRNDDPKFLFICYTHHRPILHRLTTIHDAADRQRTARSEYAAYAVASAG